MPQFSIPVSLRTRLAMMALVLEAVLLSSVNSQNSALHDPSFPSYLHCFTKLHQMITTSALKAQPATFV